MLIKLKLTYFIVPQQARFEVDFSQVLWDDLEYRTRSIEIKYWGISATDLTKKADSGILTTVYFQFDPAVCYFSITTSTCMSTYRNN